MPLLLSGALWVVIRCPISLGVSKDVWSAVIDLVTYCLTLLMAGELMLNGDKCRLLIRFLSTGESSIVYDLTWSVNHESHVGEMSQQLHIDHFSCLVDMVYKQQKLLGCRMQLHTFSLLQCSENRSDPVRRRWQRYGWVHCSKRYGRETGLRSTWRVQTWTRWERMCCFSKQLINVAYLASASLLCCLVSDWRAVINSTMFACFFLFVWLLYVCER